MLIVILMGFASGLPFALFGSTLKAWATDAGLDLTSIGFMTAFSYPLTYKFLLAPFMDRFAMPFLGRRRGWMVLVQAGLVGTIFALSLINPARDITMLVVLGFSVATLSAMQDIVIDAYRREFLLEEEFGLGISLAIMGYRLAMMFTSGFALILADIMPWSGVYQIMAAAMLVGVLTTFWAPEPNVAKAPRTLAESFWGPLKEFFARDGALWVLAFIFFYKIGDQMAGTMTTPFYLKIGFTKTEIGAVVKLFGIWAVIGGGLIGGAAILKIGLRKSLWAFGTLQALSTLGFAYLAHMGNHLPTLTGVIVFENLTAGMGTAAYTTYMASMTNKRYTATQYALFTSLMALPSTTVGMFTGWMVEKMDWGPFFVLCTLAAIPGMLLIFKMNKLAAKPIE